VFDGSDLRRYAELVALEVDDPVLPLVATTLVTRGDTPFVIASTTPLQRLQEATLRFRLCDRIERRDRTLSGARRCRLKLSKCHVLILLPRLPATVTGALRTGFILPPASQSRCYTPSKKSICSLSGMRVTMAFL